MALLRLPVTIVKWFVVVVAAVVWLVVVPIVDVFRGLFSWTRRRE